MYRARREVEPPIPASAVEFTQTISSTILNVNYRHSVMTHIEEIDHYGAIFYSEKMAHELLSVDTISFDGTFYTCPKQFTQLWTISGKFGIHTFPAIHCFNIWLY